MGHSGMHYDDIRIGNKLGEYKYKVSRDHIVKFIKNMDISVDQFMYQGNLIAPPAMALIFVLRSIVANDILLDGAILVGHELDFIEPVYSDENICIEVHARDKYIKKEKKYVVFEYSINSLDGNVKILDRMKAIWPI